MADDMGLIDYIAIVLLIIGGFVLGFIGIFEVHPVYWLLDKLGLHGLGRIIHVLILLAAGYSTWWFIWGRD
jgi:uncharacterized membrane protein YuzA (DUF378 family)